MKLRALTSWRKEKCGCLCLTEENCYVRVFRWVSLIVVVLGVCVKTSDRCLDVSISLSLEQDYMQGEVSLFRVKCQVTRIGTCSQHRDGHWSGSMVFLLRC